MPTRLSLVDYKFTVSSEVPHHDRRALIAQARTADHAELAELLVDGAASGSFEKFDRRARESIAQVSARSASHPVISFDESLPINSRRVELAELIRAHQVSVICGETGSGKTTQLPKICLSIGRGTRGIIGHTQPRRIAARSVAQRIADELQVSIGDLVGSKVRFNDSTGDSTAIKLMTDGILLAETQHDPTLSAYDTIIIDEAHERSLNIDFLLGYLKTLLPRRPDLKVIVTSATIDPKRFSDFFGGPRIAPVVEVSGRMYPVEIRYRPIGRADDPDRDVSLAVADAVSDLCSTRYPKGDVLVFLPGEKEIRLAADTIRREDSVKAEVLPLFARLTAEEQDRVFRHSDNRRVILATNVAETSLTIPGIRYVVDTGVARINRFDPISKIQRLHVEPISRASANQRSGRCGRVSEGVCIRLYAEEHFKSRDAFTDPEILRTSLASVLLTMKSLDLGTIENFPFIDSPGDAAIREAALTLFELGATTSADSDAELTEVGRTLARLPVDPKIGRVILAGSTLGCLKEALPLAAALSIQDPRERPADRQVQADAAHSLFRDETSDFLTLLNIWDEFRETSDDGSGALRAWCREHFISFIRMREWIDTFHQLRELCNDLGMNTNSSCRGDTRRIHGAVLTGLISNVLCRDESGSGHEYSGPRGLKAFIFPGSALFKKSPKWIMAAEIAHTTKIFARTVARIDPEWIGDVAPQVFKRELSDPHFDPASGEATVFERVTFSGLGVVPRRRVPLAPIDPSAARRLFLTHALAANRLEIETPFVEHNRRVLREGESIESKLRRKGVIRSADELADRFDLVIPQHVVDRAGFIHWHSTADDAARQKLLLNPIELLNSQLDTNTIARDYPDTMNPGRGSECTVHYEWDPGKESDGVSIIVPLLRLDEVDLNAMEWCVPGMLSEKIHAMLKALPRGSRDNLDKRSPLGDVAREVSTVIEFRKGTLVDAIREAITALYDIVIDANTLNTTSIPEHLRIRLCVVDDHGKSLGESRDIEALKSRLAGRLAKARSGQARRLYERDSITTWDFDPLPESVTVDGAITAFPMLLDVHESVRITLGATASQASASTWLATRRLFVLALLDELDPLIDSIGGLHDAIRHFKALGSESELRDGLRLLIVESVFMTGKGPVNSRVEFETRLNEYRGRLGQSTQEVGNIICRALESRFKVAGRLAGGTPRLWADSIADIREHAAYLMPKGFISLTKWERIRHYARYAESMRERLFKLREDGSGVEKPSLAKFGPYWKKYTAFIATAMNRERAQATLEGEARKSPNTTSKAPLPQTRRTGQTVNVDAGEWTLIPGNLPSQVEQYRWMLEEARIGAFTPELGVSFDVKLLDEASGRFDSNASEAKKKTR
ncbi:MAG: ATP-dependent RNA helicase HrpA [Phycisphaerales bacterium]